jgi:hypothetical protein
LFRNDPAGHVKPRFFQKNWLKMARRGENMQPIACGSRWSAILGKPRGTNKDSAGKPSITAQPQAAPVKPAYRGETVTLGTGNATVFGGDGDTIGTAAGTAGAHGRQ